MVFRRADDGDLDASTTAWMAWGVVLFVVFVSAFPIYRAIEPGRRADAKERYAVELIEEGAELYELSCAQCHGAEAQGGTAPAFNSKDFLFSVADEQIAQITAVGVPGSPMSAYSIDYGGPYTSAQIDAIVAHLRSFEEGAPDFPEWRYPLTRAGLTGGEIYNLGCASCHGYNLEGTSEFPALDRGSDAAEESDGRLARRIREGKDEMPAFGGSLTDEQIAEIIAHLREVQQG